MVVPGPSSSVTSEVNTPGAHTGSQSSTGAHHPPVRRPPRSKNGCLTCRRRKVRCSEQRPRCSHCERLNFECKWRPIPNPASSAQHEGAVCSPESAISSTVPAGDHLGHLSTGAVDQVFDYASFMFDTSDLWQSHSIGIGPYTGHSTPYRQMGAGMLDDIQPLPVFPEPSPASESFQDAGALERAVSVRTADSSLLVPEPTSVIQQTAEDRLLLDYFTRTHVPPILSQVETQQKWSSMRQILMALCNASAMVRYAIMAFSELLLRRQEGSWLHSTQNHYAKAMCELAKLGDISASADPGDGRENLLATLFFLSYVDILEGRVEAAHKCLKDAHTIFRQREKAGFRATEIRLFSWIRLVDARAVSAGGEGLFLSDQEEDLLVEPSPSSFQGDTGDRKEESQDGDIEDVLFQLLYQPGTIFFQKVQSFMGRISKIDPWHRSRGTVEDETEVMNIAARISKDLRELYEGRPPLMDYAIAGRLTTPHVSANLATTITKSFRSYLANFHASRIHLHRVAYKNLPLTNEASESLASIRKLAKLMEEGLSEHEALPVNMLWPLLMLGSEEHVFAERIWVKEQIMRMEKVATNARITAQVLDEVQLRQDASKTRVDIRSVMHSIFDACFAIV